MMLCVGLTLAILFTGCTGTDDGIKSDELNAFNVDKLLSVIDRYTLENGTVEITLSKESFTETCYVVLPDGAMINTDFTSIEGVAVERSSDFVSCRITIGPMTENLLGEWKLCGKSDTMRCQPVNIRWHHSTFPSARWTTINLQTVNHAVHYGGIVNPGVIDPNMNSLLSCHIVTPDGEDLVIKDDTNYPHITRTELNNPRLCAAVFDIDSGMIGNWVIYGIFRTGNTQNEVRRPLNFYLYNSDHPYEQAYNISVQRDEHEVSLDDTYEQSVSGAGNLDFCSYITPSGQTFDLVSGEAKDGVTLKAKEAEVACQLTISPITEEMLGNWEIIAKFSNGNLFDEKQHIFHLLDIDREILSEESDKSTERPIVESSEETIEKPSEEVTEISSKESSEESKPTEVPRIIETLPEQTIAAKIDTTHKIIISTENYVENESCHLITPDGLQYDFINGLNVAYVEIINENKVECGVLLNLKNENMIGQWSLVARATRLSTPIERRLPFTIRIEGSGPVAIDNVNFNVGEQVDITLGPEDTVYCKIEDNNGHTVYDGFGQCKIVLHRATIAHRGTWMMYIAQPGVVQLQAIGFIVDVLERGNKPVVTSSVVTEKPAVTLSCSVPTQHKVRACKFRDPQNNILVAAHEVGVGGYTFNGVEVNYESNASDHSCTLRLNNPSVLDFGIWRCALDTSTGTYYGFFTVVYQEAIQLPEVAAIVNTEAVLQAESEEVSYLENEPVVMSCFVPAHVQYCYFRARNGSVYNVFPGMSPSDNFEYVGSGLDAGECGIRFNRLTISESGNWTCHVGLYGATEEQRAPINVFVKAQMQAQLLWHGTSAVVQAVINYPDSIDYCRFVRINGHGFTMNNLPNRYTVYLSTAATCSILIRNVDFIDLHPWTIAVKIKGQDGEISATTGLLVSLPTERNLVADIFFWILIVFLCLLPVIAATSQIPKKNRVWTYKKASSIRNSFRKSWNNTFDKKPGGQI